MFVKRKKNRSGTTSVVVAEKTKGIYKELITIGVAKDSKEIDSLVNAGHDWISKEESRRHPQLDLYGEEREACDREREEVRRVLSNVSNISMDGEVKVAINDVAFSERTMLVSLFQPAYPLLSVIGIFLCTVICIADQEPTTDRVADDSKWDGLKGYLTNTDIPIQDVYTAYHNLWHVERAFRIAKSKIEIRPMFHFTRKRIEAHICICFVALKVYKELERMLKVSEIKMSVDKVLALAKTITTIQIKLPLNNEVYTQTMLMARHQKIAKLFDEEFWVTQ